MSQDIARPYLACPVGVTLSVFVSTKFPVITLHPKIRGEPILIILLHRGY